MPRKKTDDYNFIPITFPLRGTAINKLTADEIAKRGLDSVRYVTTLGFILQMLNYRGFDCLARKVDVKELYLYFSTIGEMMQEFADEIYSVIQMLDDLRKANTEKQK